MLKAGAEGDNLCFNLLLLFNVFSDSVLQMFHLKLFLKDVKCYNKGKILSRLLLFHNNDFAKMKNNSQ